jgi:hypothetical protein
VLQQLLEGRISFPLFTKKGNLVDTLKKMASDRRESSPVCCKGSPSARMTLERTICRCLEPNPEERFASGAELAEQLDGCRRLRESERQLPPVPKMFGRILRRPFVWLVVLVVLPQVAASAVNIVYNLTQIVAEMTAAQKAQFYRTVNIYNGIVYPLAILAFVLAVRPIARCWRGLSNAERLTEGDVNAARRRALRIPRFIAALTAIGWFPGGFIFPFAIWTTTGLEPSLACHFVASFVLSGMIALAYSLCGVEFVVLRGLYPALWRDAQHFTAVAREELNPVNRHLNWIERLAVSIPLIAAMLLVIFGSTSNPTFKWLVAALIFVGLIGARVTGAITRHLLQVIVALTKPKG